MDNVIILKVANGFQAEIPDINVEFEPGVYIFKTLPELVAFLVQLYTEVPDV